MRTPCPLLESIVNWRHGATATAASLALPSRLANVSTAAPAAWANAMGTVALEGRAERRSRRLRRPRTLTAYYAACVPGPHGTVRRDRRHVVSKPDVTDRAWGVPRPRQGATQASPPRRRGATALTSASFPPEFAVTCRPAGPARSTALA